MKKVVLLLVTLGLWASSCQKDIIVEESCGEDTGYMQFNASVDADTKTCLNGTQVRWELNDKLSLWYGTLETSMTQSDYFVGSVGSDARYAVLNGFAEESDDYMAVYPRSAAIDCSKKGKLTVNLPMEQNLRVGSFGSDANVSVAYSNTTSLTFKNVGGLLALKILATGGHTIKKIRLTGTAAMTGEVEIKKATLPAVDEVTEGINFLTLDCGDGIKDMDDDMGSTEGMDEEIGEWSDEPGTGGETEEMDEEPGDWPTVNGCFAEWSATKATEYAGDNVYYMVALPGSHTGFALTFVDSDGKTAVAKSSYAYTIDRNSNTYIATISLSDGNFKKDKEIYINEIFCHEDKIELYNPNDYEVDLSGYYFTKDDEKYWAIPCGTVIPAKGYKVFTAGQDDCTLGPTWGISGDKGFELKLSNGKKVDKIDNTGESLVVIGETETYGRKTDGSDEWVVFSTGTIYEDGVCDGDNAKGTVKGDTPVVQSDVVLNEINGTDSGKFVELYNKSAETVNLNGWTLVKDGETVWTGTSSHSVAAGGYLVLYSKKSTIQHESADEFSSGISAGKSLRLTIRDASNSSSDTFTRGYSPWGSDMTTCSYSFGRTPDGTGDWKLTDATPGEANGASKGDIPQN